MSASSQCPASPSIFFDQPALAGVARPHSGAPFVWYALPGILSIAGGCGICRACLRLFFYQLGPVHKLAGRSGATKVAVSSKSAQRYLTSHEVQSTTPHVNSHLIRLIPFTSNSATRHPRRLQSRQMPGVPLSPQLGLQTPRDQVDPTGERLRQLAVPRRYTSELL